MEIYQCLADKCDNSPMPREIHFSEWLTDELRARNWTNADLARAAHLSPQAIGHYVNQLRSPGADALRKIARALGYAPEDVYRVAGILPEHHVQEIYTASELYLLQLYRASPDIIKDAVIAVLASWDKNNQS